MTVPVLCVLDASTLLFLSCEVIEDINIPSDCLIHSFHSFATPASPEGQVGGCQVEPFVPQGSG